MYMADIPSENFPECGDKRDENQDEMARRLIERMQEQPGILGELRDRLENDEIVE